MGQDKLEKERRKLLQKAKEANGKTIGEIDTTHILDNPKNKGSIGQVVQVYLGKLLDNSPAPDFEECGLELKVTGLVPNINTKTHAYRAKERLVLHNIDYNEDYKSDFENSGLLEKCANMLITCYEYIRAENGEKTNFGSFPIIDSFIYLIPKEDLEVLKHDYDVIINKIKEGKADEISESDTDYLAACTKASDSTVRKTQPFSENPAKPRAFSLKQSYINSIIREYISNESFESITSKVHGFVKHDLESKILNVFKEYYGRTEEEIASTFNVATNAKNRFSVYVSRMFNVSNLENSEEFQKASFVLKTIRINKNGSIKEKMSFPQMDFIEVAYTPWEESSVRMYFAESRFLFLIFKETDRGYVFEQAYFYNFTDNIIDDFIGYTYKKTQQILLDGNIVKNVGTQVVKNENKLIHSTNFVGSKENMICHVRPHARDFNDSKPLPVVDKVTGYTEYEKQCFWIDTRFISAVLENKLNEYLKEAYKKLNKQSSDD